MSKYLQEFAVQRAKAILDFWFGKTEEQLLYYDLCEDRQPMWFRGGDEVDKEIREKFGQDLVRADREEYASLLDDPNPRYRLALIILWDQFPRNMFRKDAKAFAWDAKAFALSKQLVSSSLDKKLRPIERVFAYLPFEHQENLQSQSESLRLFEDLKAEASNISDEATKSHFIAFADKLFSYAKLHYDIIERFGRFPHRNEYFGRETTEEEKQFLQDESKRFGQ
ncbi:uncharacterized protein Gasu_11190 [Galdieria sulphuraria]|uniref:DUF924 domain-containing protein n=1 Tax=Galdieria sulphuraria TaxID=130081 RepID=M2Y7D0_GALSU|nr:uncharacterized protein Gasu_11190 [Galdieria sulphuraria]EME31744.1 hypothetical protein Gasu_11190 [Galdieria sulphuraria]|eukprot:XP_005708264.1 hypothetical protein Gasu_11190 [Galdieria sulphuraria]